MSAPIETRRQLQPQPLTIPTDFGGLTLKQHAFVDHYLTTGNATDATISAGYTQDRDSAAQMGSRLLRNIKIQAELKRRLGIAIAKPPEILERLTKQARADVTDVLDAAGNFDLAKARRKRILKKLKVKTTTRTTKDGEQIAEVTHDLEIHDPQAADDKLARVYGMFVERSESVNINIEQRTDLTIILQRALDHAQAAIEVAASTSSD